MPLLFVDAAAAKSPGALRALTLIRKVQHRRLTWRPLKTALKVKVLRLIEAEAVGRFAIVALLVTVAFRLMLAVGVTTLSWTVAQRLFF